MSDELTCALVPLATGTLVLPGAAVAEIAVWRRVRRTRGLAAFVLGETLWRGLGMKVLDLDVLMDNERPPLDRGRCMVILNRAQSHPEPDFYSIAAVELPRLVRVAAEDLTDFRETPSPWLLGTMDFGSEEVLVPDLANIEKQLLRELSVA